MGVDGRAAQILQQVVMEVNAVKARVTRVCLVQVREIVVDEMRKWLRWVHAL